MSYFKKTEYEMNLKNSFQVLRNCPKCGRKTHYINTKKFRINANKSKLDVWLIYQCIECKHTFNISIYERQKASSIPKEEYQRFLNNDEQLAEQYGKNVPLFRKNKAVLDFETIDYDYIKLNETTEYGNFREQLVITVANPYQLKIRPEKQIAEILDLSRSQVKSLLDKGVMKVETELPQFISVRINTGQFQMNTELPAGIYFSRKNP